MKNWSFLNKFVLIAGLVLASQGFAVEKWTDEAVQPGQNGGYYIINNEKELAWIALNTMNKESTYKIKLNADLDLKDKLWLPIGAGHGGNGFKGEFDGQGHSISNVYIKSDELLSAYNDNCLAQNLGFFGINGGGTIKDFNLKNVDIYATNSHINGCGNEISVGGLVGWKTPGGSVIENVVVSGKIYTSGKAQGVGGLIGNAHSSRVSKSVSMVNITADGDSAFVGGIVGLLKNNEVKIDSCVYAGEYLESNGNGGAVGAVAGRVYKGSANANMNGVYYDVDLFGEDPIGVVGPQGQGGKTTGEASPVSDINNEEVICMLNQGTLDANGECDKQEPWSVGGQNISWNGSDGFKVTFDADGGTFPENSKTYKMLSNGNTITADEIASPTKVGAAFAGWSLTKGASEPSDLGTATKPTRVYAVWNPIFAITFDANGGTFSDDGSLKKEKSVAKGDVITVEGIGALPVSYCKVVSNEGCDDTMYFTGWSFNPNPSTESEIVDLNELNVFASKDTTLYAVWTEVVTYTVTFNANEHGKTKVNFVRVEADGNITQPVDPTADEGYQFGGWFTDEGQEFVFETTPITKSIILYAHWIPADYTITYELEDGTNNPSNPSTYNVETSTFELAAPTREGYTFEKWYYDENFSSPATQITQGTTGAKTLYAKWIPNVYTITYRAGSVGQGTVLPSKKEHGEAINLKLINAGFSRNGYTQTGWTTTDGGEKVYESGASYTENHDLELFPTWSDPIVYTITYVCDGCDVLNETKFPRTFTIVTNDFSIPNPTSWPEGYSFGGWFKNAQFSGKKDNNFTKGTYGDFTFYGKLNKIYNITYVGTNNPNSAKTYTIDDEKKLGTPKDSAGYTFGGWFTNAEFEGDAVTKIEKGSTGDKTFYAKWIPESIETQYGAITITESTTKVDGEIVTTRTAVIDGNSIESTNIPEDITVNTVVFNRTFTPGTRSTIVLPFDIAVANTHGGTFNILKSISADFKTITLGEKEGELKAYEPYVVLTEGATLTFDGPITIKQTVSNDQQIVGSDWYFKAALEKIVFGEREDLYGRAYGFAGVSVEGFSAGQFVKAGKKAWVGPMKGYLVYTGELNGSASKSAVGAGLAGELPDEINVVVQDEQGNVVERGVMNTKTGEFRMDRWYDLQGRKLNGQPKVQGTYYRNGKRVIVK